MLHAIMSGIVTNKEHWIGGTLKFCGEEVRTTPIVRLFLDERFDQKDRVKRQHLQVVGVDFNYYGETLDHAELQPDEYKPVDTICFVNKNGNRYTLFSLPPFEKVSSAALRAWGHDADLEVFYAQFKNGQVYRYDGVPAEAMLGFAIGGVARGEVGHWFHHLIKIKAPYHKVGQENG